MYYSVHDAMKNVSPFRKLSCIVYQMLIYAKAPKES